MEQEKTTSTTHDANGFKKGHEKFGGRKVGSVNHTTKPLKEAILQAAELEGSDGEGKDELVCFLRRVAKEDLRAFVMLLGRVLPLQVESRIENARRGTLPNSRGSAARAGGARHYTRCD